MTTRRTESELVVLLEALEADPNNIQIRTSLAVAIRNTDFSGYRYFRERLADFIRIHSGRWNERAGAA